MNEEDDLRRYLARPDATTYVPEPERRNDPGIVADILGPFFFAGDDASLAMRRMDDEARGIDIPYVPGQPSISSREPSYLDRAINLLPEGGERAVRRFMRSPIPQAVGRAIEFGSDPERLADLELGGASQAASGLMRIGRERMSAEATQEALESGAIRYRQRANPADEPVRTRLTNAKTGEDKLGGEMPRVLRDPRETAMVVKDMVTPESPALEQLFGVTRADLAREASERGLSTDYVPASFVDDPRGSAAAEAIMTARNEQRLIDTLEEVDEKAPELVEGMMGWYMTQPLYRRAIELLGPEEGIKQVDDLLVTMGSFSPQSNVLSEVNRAAAERYFTGRGMGEEFRRIGKLNADQRVGTPFDLGYPGQLGWTDQLRAIDEYRRTGRIRITPKTGPYIEAHGVPGFSGFGWQNTVPVADAHFSRAVGLPFTRESLKGAYASMSAPELQTFLPFAQRLAERLDINPVSMQAILWGAMAPNTGVKTVVGAPKLEIIADEIMRTARETGLPPDLVRDAFIRGDMPLTNPGPQELGRLFGVRQGPVVPVVGDIR